MKSTGIVRKVDELGRIVIPIEIRRTLGVEVKESLEIFVDRDTILLKKFQDNESCHITGKRSEDNITLADGKLTLDPEIAKSLLEEIQTRLNHS